MPGSPPQGTVALLFTDIEGSTQLARELGGDWKYVLAQHHTIVGGAIAAEQGYVDATEGDAFFAVFTDPAAGARAAVAAQRELRAHAWPATVGELKVRMGLHVGHVERTAEGYVGLEIHRAARIGAAAHGGQLLLTSAARELIAEAIELEPLGVHRLKDFPQPEHLYCAVIDGRGAGAFPPPRTEAARPTNLPPGAPVLIGREDDIDQVAALLLQDGERLVTLTGRGGVGKTTLALAVGAQLLDAHPGGVWLTRLSGVSDPDALMSAIAVAVGAVSDVQRTPREAVINRLQSRGTTLLILDNVEHLLEASAELDTLLQSLPELRILVASQVPLRLDAEVCVPLDALDDTAALALMSRVARRRGGRPSIGRADTDALLEVVHLLDGLPLALELAAARLALLSPAQLRDRLRTSPSLLSDDRAGRVERQRSLAATVQWTLSLLGEETREQFVRLGAFAAPVELEDIEVVTGDGTVDVLDELARLLDVALVRRVETGDGRIRFGLPEALRQIAAAMLQERPDAAVWRRRHAERQHSILWPARHLFVSTEMYDAVVAAGVEIMAAVQWAREAGDPIATPLASAQAGYLVETSRMREAEALLAPLLANPPRDREQRAQLMWVRSWLLIASNRPDQGMAAADEAIELAIDPADRALALTMRGLAREFAHDSTGALADARQARAEADGLGVAMRWALIMFEAQALMYGGQLEPAAELLAAVEDLTDDAGAAFRWRRHTLWGDLAMLSRRHESALPHYAVSLEEAERRGNGIQMQFDLIGVATALAELGRDADAVEVAAIAEVQMAEMAGPEAAGSHLLGMESITAARERLGAGPAAAATARGHRIPAIARVSRTCELARAVASAGAPRG